MKYLNKPQLVGLLPGLKITKEGVEAVREHFPCCDTGGMLFDSVTNSVSPCCLHERLRKANALFRQFKEIWSDEPFPTGISIQERTLFLKWFDGWQKGSVKKGYLLKNSRADRPSFLWIVALMAIWRFGAHVLFVTLGKTRIQEISKEITQVRDEKTLIFVEQKSNFWQDTSSFDFELIINFCEGAVIPLWFAYTKEEESEDKKQTFNVRAAFQQKISKLKNKDPLVWLGEASQSRLLNVSVELPKIG